MVRLERRGTSRVLQIPSKAKSATRKTPQAVRFAAFWLVFAAALYSIMLCWMFSRGAPVSATTVAIADGFIVLTALASALSSAPRVIIMPLLALSLNFLLIGALAQNADLKGVRDVLAIIAFLGLGLAAGDLRIARYTFFTIAALVLGFGLFELLAPKAYADQFNVLQFYIMRGLVDRSVSDWAQNSLFVSSVRGGARNLLPMLGPHRVSSIFLEPVSMGNFGAIALAWAFSLPRRMIVSALAAGVIGVSAIILADARFAVIAAIIFVLVRFIPISWTRYALAPAPFIAAGFLLWSSGAFSHYGDDLPSRLASSGGVIASLSPAEIFGLSHANSATLDSGYAYVLSAFGLPCCVALWFGFVLLPTPSASATRFKLLIGFYICTLLCVSGSSLFALKTAALLWFLFGAMIAEARTAPAVRREPVRTFVQTRAKAYAA